jgi:hypothetical protein
MKKRYILWTVLLVVVAPIVVVLLMYWSDLRKMQGIAALTEKESLNFHTGAQEAQLLGWLKIWGLEVQNFRTEATPWQFGRLRVDPVEESARREAADAMLKVATKRVNSFCGNSDFSAYWWADPSGTIKEFYFYTSPCWMDSL